VYATSSWMLIMESWTFLEGQFGGGLLRLRGVVLNQHGGG
jgi:hypothetical protein